MSEKIHHKILRDLQFRQALPPHNGAGTSPEARISELLEANRWLENRVADLEKINAGMVHASQVETFARTATRLNGTLDLDSVLAIIVEETAGVMEVPAAAIFLYNEKKQKYTFASGIGLPESFIGKVEPFSRSEVQQFIKHENLAFIASIKTLPAYGLPKLLLDLDFCTIAGIIMQVNGRITGTLVIFTRNNGRRFDGNEMTMLKGLANLSAQAITNARSYSELQRHLDKQRALHEIDLAITSITNLNLSLGIILKQVTAQLEVDATAICLLSPEGRLEYVAGNGFRTDAMSVRHSGLCECLADPAIGEGRPVFIPDLAGANQTTSLPLYMAEGFASYANMPLIAKGQVIGVLEIFARTTLEPDGAWWEYFEALSTQAAIAIDSISLFENLKQSNEGLAQAYDTTLEGWSRALDLRDKETEEHTRRVVDMTERLGRAMNLTEAELVNIRRGALLHDIGKMGIPDRILLKRGPLDEKDWERMRRHPEYARDLLAPIDYLRPAIDIPYCHHEKWDGTGYPQHLKGEQIPLAARIFAIADVWDALTSNRRYRRAWTDEMARQYIIDQAGTFFDPKVVNVFVEMTNEGQD